MHQLFEVFGARHEIAFAIDLDQHADLAAGMNVVANRTFAGHARRLLGRDRNTLLAQHDDRLLQVAFGFGQGLFAIHHRRSGFFAELFYLCSRNICHSSAHEYLGIPGCKVSRFQNFKAGQSEGHTEVNQGCALENFATLNP